MKQNFDDRIRAKLEKALLYMEENISSSLTANEIAFHATLSPFHFQRLFSAYMGESLSRYLLTRRLESAAKTLIHTKKTNILELALSVGFETHSSFSKAFKRHFGTTPSAFNQNPGDTKIGPDIKRPFLLPADNLPPVKDPEIVFLTDFTFQYRQSMGTLSGAFFQDKEDEVRSQFYDLLHLSKGLCKTVAGTFPAQPQKMKDDQAIIWFGGLFDSKIENSWSEGWYNFRAGNWAVFDHIGDYSYLYQTWNFIYQRWLPQTKWHLRSEMPFEAYISGPDVTNSSDQITKIHIPVKKAEMEQHATF